MVNDAAPKYAVAVLGASDNPDRYAYKAVSMLADQGYGVFPVHPSAHPVAGIPCYPNLQAIPEPVDTISIYLSAMNSTPLIDAILTCRPRRIIVNPGAENPQLTDRCRAVGIQVQEACTLVLLVTGQF